MKMKKSDTLFFLYIVYASYILPTTFSYYNLEMSTRPVRRVLKGKTPSPVPVAALPVEDDHDSVQDVVEIEAVSHDEVEDVSPTKKKRKSPAKIAEKDRCVGKTTKGAPCTKKGSKEVNGKNYCHIHSPSKAQSDKIMCQFTLKSDKNKQCSKQAQFKLDVEDEDQMYCCKSHLPDNVISQGLSKPSPVKAPNLTCCGIKKDLQKCSAKSSFISLDGKKGFCRHHIGQKDEGEDFKSVSPQKKASSPKKVTRELCQGTTKARQPCKKYAIEGTTFCAFHK